MLALFAVGEIFPQWNVPRILKTIMDKNINFSGTQQLLATLYLLTLKSRGYRPPC